MKVYAQFKVLSTGYIAGSIPPKFSEDAKEPIDLLGSDGVFILDGRKSLTTMINDCEVKASKLGRSILGFEIIRGTSFSDKGKIIYRNY